MQRKKKGNEKKHKHKHTPPFLLFLLLYFPQIPLTSTKSKPNSINYLSLTLSVEFCRLNFGCGGAQAIAVSMRSNVANLWRKIYPEKVDHFDKLPEEIILSIFNRIGDAMALRQCCAVSRRFHSIVPEVDDVVVQVDCVTLEKEERELASSSVAAAAPHHRIASFFRIFFSVLFKPLLSLSQLIIPSARLLPLLKEEEEEEEEEEDKTVSFRSMTQILKNFNEIKRLAVELRAGEVRIEDGILLKLKAEYSSTLESCVILGATSVNCSCDDDDDDDDNDGADMDSIHESFYSEDEGLEQRVVWIVNSLVAASTRHHLLQPVIAAHKSLERLVLTDADGQGLLSMDKEQLKEQRARPLNMSLSSKRTVVPSLDVQLWYAPRLEMPDGVVLRGATLIAIRPSELPREGAMPVGSESSWAEPEGNWVVSAFEGPYGDVARMLVKERIYSIDINAF